MKGYSDKALVILPKEETLSDKQYDYDLLFKRSITALLEYLKEIGTTAYFLNTDETAITAVPADYPNWYSTLTSEDLFFAKRLCDGVRTINCSVDEEAMEMARKKYPIEKGCEQQQRFDIILKRSSLIAKELIKNTKFIIDFSLKNNPQFKVTPKVGDKKLIYKVSLTNFTVTSYMNGTPVDISYLIKEFNPLKPLYEWSE